MYVHLLIENFTDSDEVFITRYGGKTVENTVKAQKTEVSIYKVKKGLRITVARKSDNTVILSHVV